MTARPLPTVIVPASQRPAVLDACLASLERTLPANARVLIADHAAGHPLVESLARRWCDRSRLDASYRRHPRPLGLAANMDAAIGECRDDVVLLQADAVATPGWFERMAQYARKDASIATVSAWSNRGELAAFPRPGEDDPLPGFPEAIAEAAAAAPWGEAPDLPAATGPCVLLRRAALDRLGGLDSHSFAGEHALDDFCRRAAAMGWRNILCPAAYVARQPVAGPTLPTDDLAPLLARWPDYQEQVARFILADPQRPLRERLLARMDELARSGPQRDLFH
jgi:GT2 family glycosyltransferase